MTTAVLSAKVDTPTVPAQRLSPWQIAIDAIVEETGCAILLAVGEMNWLNRLVGVVRESGYRTLCMEGDLVSCWEYDLFKQLFEHGVTPEPDTAGAAVQAALLVGNEIALLHDVEHELNCKFRVLLEIEQVG